MNVLIADDHDLVVELLKIYIEKGSVAATVRTASDVDEAVALAAGDPSIDVVLLDLNMPGMNGTEGLTRVKQARPNVPVAIISGSVDPSDLTLVMNAGAAGFIPKTLKPPTLLAVVSLIVQGERFVPWPLVDRLLSDGSRSSRPAAQPLADRKDLPSFSPREREVLDLLLMGKSNKEIGLSLNLQEGTIKINLRRIYRKLGVKTRLQAVRIIQP